MILLEADGHRTEVALTAKRDVARAVLDVVGPAAWSLTPGTAGTVTTGRHMSSDYTFTSESVTEGHPDKMADQISDAILDAILAEDPMGRVACETLLTTGLVVVAGEITTSAYVDIPKIVRKTVCDIGYDRESYGFDGNTCGVIIAIDEQSPDISQGVDHRLRGPHGAPAARTRSTPRAPATRG